MEKFVLCLCIYVVGILSVSSLPYPYYDYRIPRSPYSQRALMLSGYYGRPLLRRSSAYFPDGAMTAFASGDTVATNSYLGGSEQYDPLDEPDVQLEEEPSDKVVSPPEGPPVILEGSETTDSVLIEEASTVKPIRVPKKKIPKKPIAEEEEEVEQDNDESDNDFWPFRGGSKIPSYNSFFPIVIGGYPGARTRSDPEGSFPGSATAIANSFSTGKGGVASSHATSFGDPYLSSLLRNGVFKRKIPPVQDE